MVSPNGESRTSTTKEDQHPTAPTTGEQHATTGAFIVNQELRPTDVLFGRGAPIINYAGNKSFRALVQTRRNEYNAAACHSMKGAIAKQILNEIQDKRKGRFLQRILRQSELESLGVPSGVEAWKLADRRSKLEKIKQSLRDKTPQSGAAIHGSQFQTFSASPTNLIELQRQSQQHRVNNFNHLLSATTTPYLYSSSLQGADSETERLRRILLSGSTSRELLPMRLMGSTEDRAIVQRLNQARIQSLLSAGRFSGPNMSDYMSDAMQLPNNAVIQSALALSSADVMASNLAVGGTAGNLVSLVGVRGFHERNNLTDMSGAPDFSAQSNQALLRHMQGQYATAPQHFGLRGQAAERSAPQSDSSPKRSKTQKRRDPDGGGLSKEEREKGLPRKKPDHVGNSGRSSSAGKKPKAR